MLRYKLDMENEAIEYVNTQLAVPITLEFSFDEKIAYIMEDDGHNVLVRLERDQLPSVLTYVGRAIAMSKHGGEGT